MNDQLKNDFGSASGIGEPNLLKDRPSTPDNHEVQLSWAIEAYLEELDAGRHPRQDEFVAGYPEIAEELRKCLKGLELIYRVSPQLSSVSRSTALSDRVPVTSDTRLGDFRILREIGRGGMGVVYEAEQISLPRRVALKVLPFAGVLDEKQLERFKNEARAAALLDHPSIVSIYSVGCERAVHFFAMQFVKGESLAEIIGELQSSRPDDVADTNQKLSSLAALTEEFVRGEGAAPADVNSTVARAADVTKRHTEPSSSSTERPPDSDKFTCQRSFYRFVARLGADAAEALDHAHSNGILHRDVKPGNLMLDTQGNIHITDFGLARIEAEANLTMTGDVLGTLRYMSPEQALAKRVVVDHRTDIYSLGVTLYELLTLRPAY